MSGTVKKSKWVEIDEYSLAHRKAENPDYEKTYCIYLNPFDNGGEGVTLSIHVYNNGDAKLNLNPYYFNTEISTNCYGIHGVNIHITDGISTRNAGDIGAFLIGLAEKYGKGLE